jgi:hypothetical protein
LKTGSSSKWALTPVWGTIVFIFLYIVAATLYPGGSQANTHSAGFSWANNYWCNLLNEKAINGMTNTARPVAFAAMAALCIAQVSFWWLLVTVLPFSRLHKNLILFSGCGSAIAGIFIFTGLHDPLIIIAGVLGIFALMALMAALYKHNWKWLFFAGIINIALVLLNNLIYYSKNLLVYLPLVQKLTFLVFLGWLCGITLRLHKLVRMWIEPPKSPAAAQYH